MKEISMTELRWWYENKTVFETMEHFDIRHKPQLYAQLDRAGIERKQVQRPAQPIRLVD